MPKGWKRKITAILFAAVLLGVGFVGGQYYLHRLYQRQVEVSYRRALGEFGTHLGEIAAELGRARLAVSNKQKDLIAANLRRLIYAAQSNLGELPLGEIQLERMSRLLGHVYEQTYAYAQGKWIPTLYRAITSRLIMSAMNWGTPCPKGAGVPLVSWHEYFLQQQLCPSLCRPYRD